MGKTHILVICRHAEILQTIVRLVNNNPDWEATGCESNVEALNAFKITRFPLVLLGSGIDPASENLLRQSFTSLNPDIKIVEHYGGGSGLLSAEILQALS
jgi:hypothetical protein